MSIGTGGDAQGRPKIGCINKAFQLNTASFLLLKRFKILLGCKRVQYQQCDKNMTYYLVLIEEESFICESAKTSSPFPSSPESPGPCPTAPSPPPQPHHHMMLEKSIATIQILKTRCQIWGTIELHRAPISKVL